VRVNSRAIEVPIEFGHRWGAEAYWLSEGWWSSEWSQSFAREG